MLVIDRMLFAMTCGRDVDFHDSYPQTTYLDRRTGVVIWLYEDDEDAWREAGIPAEMNRQGRERVAAHPEAYDATVVLALAAQAAGRLDGAAIRDRSAAGRVRW